MSVWCWPHRLAASMSIWPIYRSYIGPENVMNLMREHVKEVHNFSEAEAAAEIAHLHDDLKESTESFKERTDNMKQWQGMLRAEARDRAEAARKKARQEEADKKAKAAADEARKKAREEEENKKAKAAKSAPHPPPRPPSSSVLDRATAKVPASAKASSGSAHSGSARVASTQIVRRPEKTSAAAAPAGEPPAKQSKPAAEAKSEADKPDTATVPVPIALLKNWVETLDISAASLDKSAEVAKSQARWALAFETA